MQGNNEYENLHLGDAYYRDKINVEFMLTKLK